MLGASTSYQVGLSGVSPANIEATVTDVANALIEQPQPAQAAAAAPAPGTEAKTTATRIQEGKTKRCCAPRETHTHLHNACVLSGSHKYRLGKGAGRSGSSRCVCMPTDCSTV